MPVTTGVVSYARCLAVSAPRKLLVTQNAHCGMSTARTRDMQANSSGLTDLELHDVNGGDSAAARLLRSYIANNEPGFARIGRTKFAQTVTDGFYSATGALKRLG